MKEITWEIIHSMSEQDYQEFIKTIDLDVIGLEEFKAMSYEEIHNLTPEQYHAFLQTVDPDVMGFDGKIEGMKMDAD